MAIRRTFDQKQRALQKRLEVAPKNTVIPIDLPTPTATITSEKKPQKEFSVDSILHTDIRLLQKDLLKTVGIALLLLIGIFGIFIYLR